MKVTIAQCEAALRAHVGQVPPAAEELGVTPQALHGRIRRNKRLQRVQAEIRDAISAVAVKGLVRRIYQGDLAAARFWLERREKGDWSARTEVTTRGDAAADALLDDMSPEEILALLHKVKSGAE